MPYQNYMMHRTCELAGRHKFPFQIHTGLQTGSGDFITNSRPTDLTNLLKADPDVRFVMFHGGYPYWRELATMAKTFRNAYIDMCWMYVISPALARECLSEWIETVPANKLLGFGGDYNFVEGVYAHAKLAREVMATVLAEKVVTGYLTEEDASELGRRFLRTNAIELFDLRRPK